MNVGDEDREETVEKEPITREAGRCIGIQVKTFRTMEGGMRAAPVRVVPDADGARYRKSWSFAPYVAPESHTDSLYNVSWMIRASSGSNLDFNAD